MISFNLKKVENILREDSFSEKDYLIYLLVFSLFMVTSYNINVFGNYERTDFDFFYLLADIIFLFGTVIFSFRFNKKDFIKRYVVLNVVIGTWAMICISILFLIFSLVMNIVNYEVYFSEKTIFTIYVVTNLVIVFLTIFSFKRINDN